jgi:hypothetical protein
VSPRRAAGSSPATPLPWADQPLGAAGGLGGQLAMQQLLARMQAAADRAEIRPTGEAPWKLQALHVGSPQNKGAAAAAFNLFWESSWAGAPPPPAAAGGEFAAPSMCGSLGAAAAKAPLAMPAPSPARQPAPATRTSGAASPDVAAAGVAALRAAAPIPAPSPVSIGRPAPAAAAGFDLVVAKQSDSGIGSVGWWALMGFALGEPSRLVLCLLAARAAGAAP